MSDTLIVRVALDHPLAALYDYAWRGDVPPRVGQLVGVPFGRRSAVGLIFEIVGASDVAPDRLKDVECVCDSMPPVSTSWLELIAFAASYYQRALGEVALPALPAPLREPARWARLFAREPLFAATPEGRQALPEVLPARAVALRRLAQALLESDKLSASTARDIHAKAVAALDSWIESGWARRVDGQTEAISAPVVPGDTAGVASGSVASASVASLSVAIAADDGASGATDGIASARADIANAAHAGSDADKLDDTTAPRAFPPATR
ncbi:MAG TPA: primosomal protein N', partial [Pararobbsia sp.]|nr:primosomal protein N' [Pararobbsia sp.]